MLKLTRDTKIKIILFSVAVVVLWFTSQCSFRFSVNDSVDSNMMAMGGKLLLNGRYAYKDFLDYKGIVIYLVHALSLIIFPNSFHGIYFLEIISAYCFYLYSYKSLKLLQSDLNEYYLMCISLIGCSLAYVSASMTNGDQIEEFALSFIAYFIYQISRYLYEGIIDKKAYIFIGLHIGLLFWSKFLCLIVHFLLFISFIIYLIIKKDVKNIIKIIMNIILGVCIITIPLLCYFIFTDTFIEMVQIYFYENIFDYGRQSDTSSSFIFFSDFVVWNLYIIGIYVGSFIAVIKQRKKDLKVFIFGLIHLLSFILLTLCNAWQYYYMPTFAFIPIELVYLLNLFKKEQIRYVLLGMSVGLLVLSYFNHINNHNPNKEWSKQQAFAEIIKQTENAKVINLAFDNGFLLVADVLPIDYFYARICRHDNVILNRYLEIIQKHECDYVIVKYIGNKEHNQIDWNIQSNIDVDTILTSCNYELVYFCEDVGRDDYTPLTSIVCLYKLSE